MALKAVQVENRRPWLLYSNIWLYIVGGTRAFSE